MRTLDNSQLNNSLAHSNFRYFTFSEKEYQNTNFLCKKLTLPGKQFNFYSADQVNSKHLSKFVFYMLLICVDV